MWRTIRRLLLLLVVAAAMGVLAVAVTARPDLERTRDDAVERWRPMSDPLDARYAALADVNDAVREAGGPERDVSSELDTALAAWRASNSAPVATQVDAANALEGLARRLRTAIAASERLSDDPGVGEAVEGLDRHPVPESARVFNAAAADYHEARVGFLREPVAALLGHDPLSLLDVNAASD